MPTNIVSVYDVTDYREDHPGGDEILRHFAGKDATTDFVDAGHSSDAYTKLKTLHVGRLSSGDRAQTTPKAKAAVTEIAGVNRDTNSRNQTAQTKHCKAEYSSLRRVIKGFLWGGPILLLYAFNGYSWHGPQSPHLRPQPQNGWTSYMGGFLTATAINIVAATMFALRAKRDLLQRHSELEEYPRVRRTALPIRPQGYRGDTIERRQLATLVDRQRIAPRVYRMRLEGNGLAIGVGQHVKILAEIDGTTVQRSYSPVYPVGRQKEVDLIIKIYPNGRLGNYLLNLPLHSRVEVRGPFGRYAPNPAWKSIACIAGGTGITPIYQVMRDWPGEVALLYGSEAWEDIILRDELDELVHQSRGRIRVHHVLHRQDSSWNGLTGLISEGMIRELLPKPAASTGFLVCGADAMVRAIRGHLDAIQAASEKADVFIF